MRKILLVALLALICGTAEARTASLAPPMSGSLSPSTANDASYSDVTIGSVTQTLSEWLGNNNSITTKEDDFAVDGDLTAGVVMVDKATAVDVTLENVYIGRKVVIYQKGAGEVVIAPDAGITLRPDTTFTLAGQYYAAECIQLEAAVWFCQGAGY